MIYPINNIFFKPPAITIDLIIHQTHRVNKSYIPSSQKFSAGILDSEQQKQPQITDITAEKTSNYTKFTQNNNIKSHITNTKEAFFTQQISTIILRSFPGQSPLVPHHQ